MVGHGDTGDPAEGIQYGASELIVLPVDMEVATGETEAFSPIGTFNGPQQ